MIDAGTGTVIRKTPEAASRLLALPVAVVMLVVAGGGGGTYPPLSVKLQESHQGFSL